MDNKKSPSECFVKRLDLVMTGKLIPSNLQIRSDLLADICGVSSQAARKWLTCKSMPDYANMILIATKFSVTTSYLIGEIDISTIGKSDDSLLLKNNTKKGVITVDVTEDMFSDILSAGDTAICHPCNTVLENGAIYILQTTNQRFFRKLSLTDSRELIIEYTKDGELIKNTYTDQSVIEVFLSSLVGKVEAVLRKV